MRRKLLGEIQLFFVFFQRSYQARIFDFGIQPDHKVLDMGSGHIPFSLATHLADISTKDGSIGRGGASFKLMEGKPVYECAVENTPFADKEFDFVYCWVLWHVFLLNKKYFMY